MDGTFAVLGPNQVGYLDYFGSGVETIAHLRENGRITVMFCAFDGRRTSCACTAADGLCCPRITASPSCVRASRRPAIEACGRSSWSTSTAISDSCGWSVPLMQHVADRDVLDKAQERRDDDYFVQYAATKNATSIDGLPGLCD